MQMKGRLAGWLACRQFHNSFHPLLFSFFFVAVIELIMVTFELSKNNREVIIIIATMVNENNEEEEKEKKEKQKAAAEQ